MRSMKLRNLLLGLVAVAALAPGTAAGKRDRGTAIRRLALVAGTNNGGKERVRLRYARTDAEVVARVLRQLGGVAGSDLELLLEPDREQFKAGLRRLRARLRQARTAGRRLEVIVYYSGHSDERGLLLRGRHMTYRELRQAVRTLPADVRLAVLDSCASGSLTRGKGGRRRPPFLVDGSGQVRGHAFLTSASADEAAQESDRLRGSFFTHYLVTGMRGAADNNRDGRVTLSEAYAHAFHETLARTESTRSGPQHPNYDMQLAGRGDLVLTDLRGTSALLVLAPGLKGRFFIRDKHGRLVAEINKIKASPLSLGLEPGSYQVTLEQGKQLRRGTVTLRRNGRVMVDRRVLDRPLTRVATVARGNAPPGVRATSAPLRAPLRDVPFSFTVVPFAWGGDVRTHFSLALLSSYYAELRGVDISLGLGLARGSVYGAQVAMAFNYVGLDVKGLQLAMAGNYVGNDFLGGVQIGMGFNIVRRDMLGLQVGMGFNIAGGDVDGVQLAMGFNIARRMVDGVQVGMGFNIAAEDVDGTQVSLGFNIARGLVNGTQAGLGFNVAPEVVGAQISSGFNYVGRAHGAQVGIINYGGLVEGAQIGIINYGGCVSKTQIGIVNIAGESDNPIGLLNLVRDGVHALELWASDAAPANVGLKLGGRNLYSVFGVGYQPSSDRKRWLLGIGFGGRIPLGGRFFVDTDLMSWQINDDEAWTSTLNMLHSWRVALNFRLHRYLALFGGVSVNVLTTRVDDGFDFGLFQGWKLREGETTVRLWPGLFAGVQI